MSTAPMTLTDALAVIAAYEQDRLPTDAHIEPPDDGDDMQLVAVQSAWDEYNAIKRCRK